MYVSNRWETKQRKKKESWKWLTPLSINNFHLLNLSIMPISLFVTSFLYIIRYFCYCGTLYRIVVVLNISKSLNIINFKKILLKQIDMPLYSIYTYLYLQCNSVKMRNMFPFSVEPGDFISIYINLSLFFFLQTKTRNEKKTKNE